MNSGATLPRQPTDEADPSASSTLLDSVTPIWQQVLMLAWPALLQNWLVLTVNLSDRLLAGRFLPDDDMQTATQAAQTTAGYISWLISAVATLINTGASALVARMIGAKDRQGACLVLHQALWLALIVGLTSMVFGLIFLERGLGLLQLSGTAAEQARDYLRPMLYQLPLQMLCLTGIACLIGAGDTKTGMWVLGAVAFLNLPMTWICFHGLSWIPPLGFTGIAIGTACANSLGGVAVLLILLRGRAGLQLHFHEFRPRREILARVLRISIPGGIDNLSMQIGYLWFLGIVNHLGDVAAAAHGIALTWEAMGYQSGAAFGTAAVAVVGQSLGAERPDRASRGGWVAFGLGMGLMSVMGIIFFSLAQSMFQIFCPHPSQEAIVQLGVPVLRLVAFGMPALASCIILAWALRGAGDTRRPMLATWVGFFGIRIPLAYWLTGNGIELGGVQIAGWNLGLYGAWLAMFWDLQIRGMIILIRFAGGKWKSIRV